MDNLEAKAKKAQGLKFEYSELYSKKEHKLARQKESEYIALRSEIISEIDSDIIRQKSEPMRLVKKRVANRKKPKRIETGIRSLDYELVNDKMKANKQKGGLALGNFIQIAGSKGTGKSSFMLKMLTGFSNYEKVCWFDFEMGEARVVEKLEKFTHNDENMLYYASSRNLEDVISEIKFLNAMKVNHFVIDSAMKITVQNADRYDKFSKISGELSALTSSLGINIYMINQMSQTAEKEGHLSIKHGNDAEYDADFMFFILAKPLMKNGKAVIDEVGIPIIDETARLLKCTKNRQDERLFSVIIPKSEITGIEFEVMEYEMEETS